MKRIFTAAVLFSAFTASAFAADLPVAKGPPIYTPPVPVFTWTGVYVGGQIGYQWGQSRDPYLDALGVESVPLPLAHSDSGIVGGAHIGYNYQFSSFVLGIEGDVNGSSYRGSEYSVFEGDVPLGESTRIGIEGSIRGRIGWAWDRVLIYGTGGVAFASVKSEFDDDLFIGTPFESTSVSKERTGWTAGGGIEYAIDNNWSVRAEYLYSDYGHARYDLSPVADIPPGEAFIDKHITTNRVTAGFSYKFDFAPPPTPVVAKY
jgi:outer membrane immunogenic protein